MARSAPTSGWKVALVTSAGMAVVFVIFGGISHGFSQRTIITLALALAGAVGGLLDYLGRYWTRYIDVP